MERIFQMIPEIDMAEAQFLQSILKDKSDDEVRNFINIYRTRRRDPMIILVTALIGFVGISGVHRFLMNQIGMGILYLFTGGLCLIGTIVDLINYKSLALEYNQRVAQELLMFYK